MLLAALCSLPLAGGACSSDDDGDDTVVADYAVEVTTINGSDSDEPVALRCDATLAVQVAISSSDPQVPFVLKPAYACGTSTRCGYVRIEALDASDAVLARVDTATLAGVLTLPSADSVPVRIRTMLMSGVDREPLENPSGEEASATVEPTFEPPSTTCEMQGAGGEGGVPGAGGAPQGGAPQGGAPQGGSPSGGAGGAPQGGAPQGGAPSGGGEGGAESSAGAGGAAAGASGAGITP